MKERPLATGSTVLLACSEGTATIRLNRPEARNSMTVELLDQLEEAIRTASSDPQVKVIVVAGDQVSFSSGADLKTVRALLDDWPSYLGFLHRIHDVFSLLEDAPVPTIAQVRGFALAGGLELMLCCDLAIASDNARIGDQHSNFGLIAGGGGIPRLIRRIGLQPALEILYTGRWLSGVEAARLGIVLRSVPDDQLDGEVSALAQRLTSKSGQGLRYLKRAAKAGIDLPLETALRAEQAALIEYFSSSNDPRRGVEAFISKTEPVFEE